MKNITIFTPTYNREKVIRRLYESLKKQTCKDFIWLIVDDGSTDNTESQVKKWIADNIIEIKYIKQEHMGKSQAHNRAAKMAETELFLCLDSNDFVSENMVYIILDCWKKVKEEQDIVGILSPKRAEFKDIKHKIKILPKYIKIKNDKKPSAKAFNDKYYIEEEKAGKGYVKSTLRDAYRIFGLKGEAMLVFRTAVISAQKFPGIEGEHFVPEAYLYDIVDKKGKLVILNRRLCIHRYQNDGYTFNMAGLIASNPKGYLLYIEKRLKEDTSLKTCFCDSIRYIAIAKAMKKTGIIKGLKDKSIAMAAYPFGVLFYYLRYKRIL